MNRRRCVGGLWAAVVVAIADVASAAGPSRPPDVLVISVDTLRPDALGWVAGRNPTPALDALAAEGFRFPAAVSPAPLTLPSHASLFSGLVPRRHGVRDNGQVLPGGSRLLAETLRDRGYDTAAFVSGYPLRSPFGLARGFGTYDDQIPSRNGVWRERSAAATTAAALGWLASRKAGAKPFFLFVHYYDPHDPYEPPARFQGTGTRAAYDGEVRAVDEAVATLRRGLDESRPLLTVFTGDHGESLGEHGEDAHGFFIYDSTMLVPLVFRMPGRIKPGESRAPARLVDVTPTILDLLGLPAIANLDGLSLAPTLGGKAQAIPAAYVESQQPWLGYGWAPLSGVRTAEHKLILAPRVELYDLVRDPGEGSNLAPARAGDVARLTKIARANEARAQAVAAPAADAATFERLRALGYVGGAAEAGSSPPAGLLDPKDRLPQKARLAAADAATFERLRALGYVGGAAEAGTTPPAGLLDPKDRLPQKARLAAADAAVLARDYRGALAGFDAVLASEPDNRFALLRSATSLLELGRAAEAVARLERLLKIDPGLGEARYVLADAVTRSGDRRRAIEEWSRTVRLQPKRAAAWSNFGTVLMQGGQALRAEEAFEEAVALEPANRTFAENLGECRYQLALTDLAAGREVPARQRLMDALIAAPSLRAKAARDPRLRVLLEP